MDFPNRLDGMDGLMDGLAEVDRDKVDKDKVDKDKVDRDKVDKDKSKGKVDKDKNKDKVDKSAKALKKAAKAAKRAAAKDVDADKRRLQTAPAAVDRTHTGTTAKTAAGVFEHLDQPRSVAELGTFAKQTPVVPVSLQLAYDYALFKVVGSTDRCVALLHAFQTIIKTYKTPPGTTLSRDLTLHLGHQIEFLKHARPLSISMGNTIRWLKQEISKIGLELSDHSAQAHLCRLIDDFIKERLELAGKVIVHSATGHIGDGAVVLTFGKSNVVKQTLLTAHTQLKKQFRVVVVDSWPLFEGKRMARELVNAGLSCTYVVMSALTYVMANVSVVFVGAHAMMYNGHLFSRVGTAMVASCARACNIPVIVLCESIKFSDKVQLDSLTTNELLGPDSLTRTCVPASTQGAARLNILYDLTPADNIKKVITELGSLPASSVPVVLREYEGG